MKCPDNCGCDYFKDGYHVINIRLSEYGEQQLRLTQGVASEKNWNELREEWLNAFENALPSEAHYPYSEYDTTLTRLFGA